MINDPPIICLMGPTASGKTALSLKLAADLDGEILSVDSALVYRTMDIGTAKPSLSQRATVPHHLIDIKDPSEPYSAALFQQDALRTIQAIQTRGKTPLLVGGTMLYFKALQQGLSQLPSGDQTIRSRLLEEAKVIGWQAMHQHLTQIDEVAAARINPNDPQRIQRALEVYELTKTPMTTLWYQDQWQIPLFSFLNIAVAPEDRMILHKRIEDRFDQMLNNGLIAEVEKLYARKDLHQDMPATRAVGYRQVWQYLEKTIDYDTMREKGIVATRQLAKRQLTWLRHWSDLTWFDSEDPDVYSKLLAHIKNSR